MNHYHGFVHLDFIVSLLACLVNDLKNPLQEWHAGLVYLAMATKQQFHLVSMSIILQIQTYMLKLCLGNHLMSNMPL